MIEKDVKATNDVENFTGVLRCLRCRCVAVHVDESALPDLATVHPNIRTFDFRGRSG